MYTDILKSLRGILQDNEIRVCSNPECKKIMVEGYLIEGGVEYYCSDECLATDMTSEEFDRLYDNGNGDTYHTDWDYQMDVLVAIDRLVTEAPVLQEGELGIHPMNVKKGEPLTDTDRAKQNK